jgi:hypothetical protein
MAGLAESVSERLVIKLYTDADIDSVTEPDPTVDPGRTGGQILRHVSHNLGLNKDNYRPNEKREDRQQSMGQHGSRTVPGTINGYLSPGTHKIPFQAVMRSAWSAPLELDEGDLTSAAFDATAKTVTFGGGDPVALGLLVGMSPEFGGLATAANNRKYVITGFSGSNNRVVGIYPAPVTEAADTAFTLVAAPKIMNPAFEDDFVKYKAAIEVRNPDIVLSRLYTEVRFGGFDLSIGVNANVGLNFSVLGRNRQVLTGSTPLTSPFYTAPASETSTDIPTSMHGLLLYGGQVIGVVTGLNIKVDLSPEAAKGENDQGLVADIMLDKFVLTGDFTVFLKDGVVLAAFDNETEFGLLSWLPSSKNPTAHANTFFMPRTKINSNNESEVNKAKAIQCQFEAGRYFGSAPGIPSTTLMITDTAVV